MGKVAIALTIIALALMLVTFRPLDVQVLKDEQVITESDAQPQAPVDHHNHSQGVQHPADSSAATQADSNKTGNPHFDQLTPEMQQALKDKLLLEGPMETYQRPDGVIVLPSNGRFTQMPVAVQMPDGSIQIREYSTLPQKTPSSPKSK